MADSAATAFDTATTRFAIKTPNFRCTRRLGCEPFFRLDQGGRNQLGESFLCFTTILFLAALCTRDDQDGAFIGEATPREASQALLNRVAEHNGALQVETQLNGR